MLLMNYKHIIFDFGNVLASFQTDDLLRAYCTAEDLPLMRDAVYHNWQALDEGSISYEEYQKITDKQHLSKAKSMPIKFLKASGKGFFVDKEGYALAIREELADVIKSDAFKAQMKDIIEYRTMEYYRRRYVEK